MAKKRSRVLDVVGYGAGRALMWLFSVTPERPTYWLFGALGRLFFRCSRKRQRYALVALRLAFPEGRTDAELLRIARIATGNFAKVFVDMVRAERMCSGGRMRQHVDLTAFDQRLPHGPFIGVTPHLGAWELAAFGVVEVRGTGHAIARIFKNPLLNDYLVRSRARFGLHLHPRRGGVKHIARALADGQNAMVVPDQYQRLRGVRVPFFGRVTSAERSAAVLGLRTGAPISVGAMIRVGPGFRFRAELFEPMVATRESEDFEADVARVTREILRRIEALVLEHPEQYLWIHNRFRDEPAGGGEQHDRKAE